MDETPARLPIDIPGFSGPLELLVHLISKKEMDIFSVSLADITDDFIKSIDAPENRDLDIAGEYLVLAATLIRFKARALLPKEQTTPDEEEIEDQVLEERRKEYDRFREVAGMLRHREEENAALFPRSGPPPEGKGQVIEYTEVSVYDLYKTFQQIIEEIGEREKRFVTGESFSVDEKMMEIETLLKNNDVLVLSDFLRTLESKLEIIVVFLALLELIRLCEVRAVQKLTHHEIVLERGEKLNIPLSDDEDDDDYDGDHGDIDTDSDSHHVKPEENKSEQLDSSDSMDSDHG